MTLLVLARHAESDWSAAGRLTGWSDPPLSIRGERRAYEAGGDLAALGVAIDRVYTSLLRRATQTASITLAAAGARPAAVADWRLNERHLGRLEGLTKAEVIANWGNERRRQWRDDALSRPPPLGVGDPSHPRRDPRYRHVPADQLPDGEPRRDADLRVLAFFHERVVPDLGAGRTVLLVAHLGPLRALAHHLGCLPPGGSPLAAWPHAELRHCQVAAGACCQQGAAPAGG